MFRFFKKRKIEENNHIASITYYIDEQGKLVLDVQIEDYEEESIDSLGKIIAFISSPSGLIQTLDMIRNYFTVDNQQDKLTKIFIDLANQPAIMNHVFGQEEGDNKPCIKPSEMI